MTLDITAFSDTEIQIKVLFELKLKGGKAVYAKITSHVDEEPYVKFVASDNRDNLDTGYLCEFSYIGGFNINEIERFIKASNPLEIEISSVLLSYFPKYFFERYASRLNIK